MQFNSLEFMIFFPIMLTVYFIIPRKLRELWLLAASYYFYMSWNPRYAVLIGISTLLTYAGGILIEKYRRVRAANICSAVLALCLTANLLILAVFKYGGFVLENIARFPGGAWAAEAGRHFDLLLPVGISFYTFQALGYIIDVYRGDVQAERNIVRYALFVSFFPQLVAGPIERSRNLLGELRKAENKNLWNGRRITSGAILMVWGFFMKMVIADRAAILVNHVFDQYQMYGSTELCLAAAAFALQIYCDFGSYSLIAMGSARILGISLMENFNTPYFAETIRDFWSRWHISLSSWFRDYLYIPLGGNRKGRLRGEINKILVFLVSGLWHGASWHFVVWGGIHGVYQAVSDLTNSWRESLWRRLKVNRECFSWKLLRVVSTFILVDFAWIFFRADSVTDALRIIKRILFRPTPWLLVNGGLLELGLGPAEMNILIIATVILFLADRIRYRKKETLDQFLMSQNLWFEWLVVIMLIVAVFVFGVYGPQFDPQQFIYFQF